MNTRVALDFGLTGQVVEFYPPEALEGQPSALTVRLYAAEQSNDETPEQTPTGTIDATSTTFNGASGNFNHEVSRRRMFLTSTASLVVGRRYLIQNLVGQREVVTVKAIASGSYADVEFDLGYDYPVGSTLVGLRMTWTVDSTWIADETNINEASAPFRALWQYTLGGATRKQWQLIDVTRYPARGGLTINDLADHVPDIIYQDEAPGGGTLFQRLISAGWRRLSRDLRGHGRDPNSILDGLRDELHLLGTLLEWAETGHAPPGRDVEQYRAERTRAYLTELERLVQAGKLRTTDAEGSTNAETPRPLIFRR